MVKGYVFIAAADVAFTVQDASNYQNWLTLTVLVKELADNDFVADFNHPLFTGMANSSQSPVQSGYFLLAGDYYFLSMSRATSHSH